MATLLLFNIQDEKKRTAIRLLSLRLGYAWRDVPPEQQGMTVNDLLSGKEGRGAPLSAFSDEMLVMHGFSPSDRNTLLDSMRQNGCSVRLKCVVTDTNRSWTAVRLHREISAEARAVEARLSRRYDRE